MKNPALVFRKSIYLIFILSGILLHQGYGQSGPIQGVINHYASVDALFCYKDNDVDSVHVVSLPGTFEVGDTVMLYCVQGAEIELTDIYGEDDIGRDAQNPGNTGKYSFLIINEITGNTVVLNATIRPEFMPMAAGEKIQLIEVPSYHRAEVTASGVSAPAWDGSTGGVVALFVRTTLKLSGNIDVSGTGFRGAVASSIYGGDCSSVNPDLYDSTFYHISSIRAGKKGEGTTDTRFELLRGKAMNINGGGGGNALFSGGGGGSNYSSGGRGCNESSQCSPGIEQAGGAGGFDLGRGDSYYVNGNPLNRGNRIFFGGGGGTGTRMAGKTTTAGGNGGGLVVIVADTIEGNSRWIRADGGDVSAPATGAGGGGGGGGAIVLDVSGYSSTLRLSAVGGDGGNTSGTDNTGPGGGGGGGVYWLAGSAEPGVVPVLLSNGLSGEHLSVPAIKYGAANGSFPGRKDGLEVPLRGFLFNSVPGEFTVCADQVPETIYASKPKGGDGVNYNYLWVDSSSTQNVWLPAEGTNDLQYYSFEGRKLSDTTYFRRIVTSGLLPPDTSFRIAVYVHQAITNNMVTAPDTVCWGNAPGSFSPVGSPGGGLGAGTYTYRWVKDEGTGSYTSAAGSNQGSGYTAPGLTVTTDFARVAYSGVCIDTSNALTVTVLDALTGNNITPFDTICWNTQPDLITGPVPGGGEATDKRYRWESSPASTGSWSEIAGVTTREFQPGALTETIWYRRVVFSGSDDACVDTSSPVEILNIDTISGNAILTGEQTVCTFDRPGTLQGSDPGGGYQGLYSWQWESRTISSGWEVADGIPGQKNYSPPEMKGDTTWFRRVVGSGGEARNVCTSTSNSVVINVLPSVTNNAVLTADEVKCQFDRLDELIQDTSGGETPGGGATREGTDLTRNYKWEVATGQGAPGGSWTEIGYGPDSIDYRVRPQLTSSDDYWYRRIVFSGPDLGGQNQVCSDTSDLIHITIHTAISGNTIDQADSVCFNSAKEIHGEMPSGEGGLTPSYTWIDAVSGSELPGSDGQNYTTGVFDKLETYRYRRITGIGECSDTSNTMLVTVMQLPGGFLSGDLPRACEKDTLLDIDLNIDRLKTYVTPWEVYLSDGVNGGFTEPNFMDGDGKLKVTLDTEQDSTEFDYRIGEILYRSATGRYTCVSPPDSLSGHVPIEVFRRPVPVIWAGGMSRDTFKVCGDSVVLVVDADNGTGTWSSDPPGILFKPDPGAEEIEAEIPDQESYGPYTLLFSSEAGDCVGTDRLGMVFFEQPAPANAGKDTMIFLKNSLRLYADPPTAGTGTWTLVSGNGTFEDIHAYDTYVYDLAKGGMNEFQWTIVNGEDEGTCITSQDISVVIQNEVKRYDGFSPNGDGINDLFIMQGLKYADEFSITFFNALGKSVRTVTHENVDEMKYDPALILGGLKEDEKVVWDGKAGNGRLLPPGTYYYVVSIMINQRDHIDNITGTDRYEYKDYVIVNE
jgi:hypothetical protein